MKKQKVSSLFPNNKPLDPSSEGYKSQVQSILTQPPPEIRVNEQANGALYVPIPVVEELLDYLFPMGWNLIPKNTQWIANEITGDGVLVIDCGGIKRELWGSGAVMMQYKSAKNGGDGDPTNLGNKITNTLQKDYPHLRSEVLKNACKLLGNVFGRNLNRKNEDKTQWDGSAPIVSEDMIDDVLTDLESLTDRDSGLAYYKNLPDYLKKNPQIESAFVGKFNPTKPTPIQTPISTTENDLPL